MTLLLNCKNLTKSFGPRPLFRDISIAFDDTERTGLIGPNGSGKSTLLKILAGLETADSGTVEARRQLRLGYLPQEDQLPAGLTARRVLVEAQSDAHIDEHDREIRADVLLGKVGFADPEVVVDTLSGGWKKRVALARELVREPDLLLLDEPTNHLDVESILWLEELLAQSRFATLTITHDRLFLQRISNRIIEVDRRHPQGLLSVNGSYADFLAVREELVASQERHETNLRNTLR